MGVSTTAKVVAASAVAIIGVTTLNTGSASAYSVSPIEVTPLCSVPEQGKLLWQIDNKNNHPINVNWANAGIGATGSKHAAANAKTVVATDYRSDVKIQTVFTDETNTSPLVKDDEMQGVTCTPAQLAAADLQPELTCTDNDALRQYINVSWVAGQRGVANIELTQALPCDVTLYLSSYAMPDHYDGQGFYLADGSTNPTALPQQLHHSTKIELHKGQTGAQHVNVNLPDQCKNVQIDVYFAPEVTELPEHDLDGHGTQNILSDVYLSNGACQQHPGNDCENEQPYQPQQPGKGAEGNVKIVEKYEALEVTEELEITETSVETEAGKGQELAETGASTTLPAILASVMALTAAIVVAFPRLRRQS